MLPKTSYEQHRFSDYFKTNLPHHWSEKRLGFLAAEEKAAFVDGPFGSDLKATDYVDEGVPLIQLNNIRDSKHLMQNMKFVSEEKKQELFRHIAIPGDIVIAKMAEPVARAAIVNEAYQEYVIVADCVKFTPNLNLINLRYLVWAINCDYVRINAELVSTGTTRVRINLGELKKLKIPYPTELEQKAIANFLDHETAKIDTLIEQQQQLIQLLKEKRQAVISHSVTKGLNPDAPMKDSGVEWLGEVPAHWEVTKLKYYAVVQGGYAFNSDSFLTEGVQLLRIGNVYQNQLALDRQPVFVSSAFLTEVRNFVVSKGDILMSLTGTLGKRDYGFAVHVEDEGPFLLNQRVAKVSPTYGKVTPEYLINILLSESYLSQLYSLPSGTKQANLSNENVLNIWVAIPPSKDEQTAISDFVSAQLSHFDCLIAKGNAAIELMQERRTALISAAVTGKIDVRHFVSKDGQAPQQ